MRNAMFSMLVLFVLTFLSCGGKPLSHFKCYTVEGEVSEQEISALEDQFGIEKGVRITQVRYFCNPAQKYRNDIPHTAALDEDHLTCYSIEPIKPFPAHVSVRDQFGETDLKTKNSELLCVPSFKKGFEEAPHAHCPGKENCCCNMSDGTGGTWPDCDPGFECRRQVNPPNPNDAIQVCVPTGTPPNQPLQLHPTQPPFCRK